ncbi:MAG: hypothetical protein R2942_13745 [Ignavibacteria bacterium]
MITAKFSGSWKQHDSDRHSPVNFKFTAVMKTGDVPENRTDVVNVYNNSAAFFNGYVSSDMNGDNLTDLSDIVITSNNAVHSFRKLFLKTVKSYEFKYDLT